jgi:hypothetical protein
MAFSRDGKALIGTADDLFSLAIWDFPKRRPERIVRVFSSSDWINSLAISPDQSRIAIGDLGKGNLSVWDLRRGTLLVTLVGHSRGTASVAWTPDGTRLVSSSWDRTVRIWDSRSHHSPEAELLVDKLSERPRLADEIIEDLHADRSISADVRRQAIEVARQRWNASYVALLDEARNMGEVPTRSRAEYALALRRAVAAAHCARYADAHLTVGLLQYRTGDSQKALLSAQRAIEIRTAAAPRIPSVPPDAHAVRAMAYFRLHDGSRAKNEVALGRQAANQEQPPEDHRLLDEAEGLVLGASASK